MHVDDGVPSDEHQGDAAGDPDDKAEHAHRGRVEDGVGAMSVEQGDHARQCRGGSRRQHPALALLHAGCVDHGRIRQQGDARRVGMAVRRQRHQRAGGESGGARFCAQGPAAPVARAHQ